MPNYYLFLHQLLFQETDVKYTILLALNHIHTGYIIYFYIDICLRTYQKIKKLHFCMCNNEFISVAVGYQKNVHFTKIQKILEIGNFLFEKKIN